MPITLAKLFLPLLIARSEGAYNGTE